MRGLGGREGEQLPRMKAPLNKRMRGRMARTVLAPLVRAVRVLVRLVRSDLSSRLSSITAVQTSLGANRPSNQR